MCDLTFIRFCTEKRPVSSMAPVVLTDMEGRARLVVGGAGGTMITTSVAYVNTQTRVYGFFRLSAFLLFLRSHLEYTLNC